MVKRDCAEHDFHLYIILQLFGIHILRITTYMSHKVHISTPLGEALRYISGQHLVSWECYSWSSDSRRETQPLKFFDKIKLVLFCITVKSVKYINSLKRYRVTQKHHDIRNVAVWVEIQGSFLSFDFFGFFWYSFYTEKFCEATELEPRFHPSSASDLKEGSKNRLHNFLF